MKNKKHSDELIEQFKAGYWLWEKFLENEKLTSMDYVLFFPHSEGEVNDCAVKYFGKFKENIGAGKIFILYHNDYKLEEKIVGGKNIKSIAFTEEEIQQILAMCAVIDMPRNFIIISLNLPYGRCGEKVIERNGVTLDEVVLLGIYKMSSCELEG